MKRLDQFLNEAAGIPKVNWANKVDVSKITNPEASEPKPKVAAGMPKVAWVNAIGDTTSSQRQIRGTTPGYLIIIRRVFKNVSFSIIRVDGAGNNIYEPPLPFSTGHGHIEVKGVKDIVAAKKQSAEMLKKVIDADKHPKTDHPEPAKLPVGAEPLDVTHHSLNGVWIRDDELKVFRATARRIDKPVIVANVRGYAKIVPDVPKPPLDYAIIHPIGALNPGHPHADPHTGFMPSAPDSYHPQHHQEIKPAPGEGQPIPGYHAKYNHELSKWLDDTYDHERSGTGGTAIRRGLLDAAKWINNSIHGASGARTYGVFVDDNFSPTSNPKSFVPAGPATFWWVLGVKMASDHTVYHYVYEYEPTKNMVIADILKAAGLGYESGKSFAGSRPEVFDLETGETFGSMDPNAAAMFAKSYVRRPRPDKRNFSFTPLQFKEILMTAQHAVSKDKTRYYLNGILLKHQGGKIEAVATNGSILSVAPIHGTLPHDIFLPMEAIKAMKVAYRAKKVPTLNYEHEGQTSVGLGSGGSLTMTVDGAPHVFKVDSTFPDYMRVVPAKHTADTVVKFDRKKLLAALQSFGFTKATKKTNPASRWIFSDTYVTIEYTPTPGDGELQVVVPCGISKQITRNLHIGMHLFHIMDMLKAFRSNTVTAHVQSAHDPILWEDTSGHHQTVMPVRV
jgi:DNA polymerase III sliding clamp (beta) subunit (PCNA family)